MSLTHSKSTEPARRIHPGITPWKPGQSGNPNGRPKGSRNKLGEAFIEAIYDDFKENGVKAIERVRAKQPAQYLKVIASILPKELHIKDASLDDMSDDELIEILAALRSYAGVPKRKKAPKVIEGEVL